VYIGLRIKPEVLREFESSSRRHDNGLCISYSVDLMIMAK